MAAKHFYRKGFLLLLFNFISTAALEKRFSDVKRCADEECSMLLCRGKAVEDFSGPDCRFLSFKKSETIYVYYKLSGRRSDLWAGSVGSNFGYFPKDLLAVNHIYTENEYKVPAEETDFVCFDTGYDKFDNYDVDALLGYSAGNDNDEYKGTLGQTEEAESMPNDAEAEENDREKLSEPYNLNNLDMIPDDPSASAPPTDGSKELLSLNIEPYTEDITDGSDKVMIDEENENQESLDSVLETVNAAKTETKDVPIKHEVESQPQHDFVPANKPLSVSKGMHIPEAKTTFGTTFDAVTTDAESTTKTTPYADEESENMEDPLHSDSDNENGTPLLSFIEEAVGTPSSSSSSDEKNSALTHEQTKNSEGKNIWTSLGDAVFSAMTGGERTKDFSSEDEDEDDEEKESAFEEKPKEPDPIHPAIKEIPDIVPEQKDNEPVSDFEKPLFDYEDEHEITVDQNEPQQTSDATEEPGQDQINDMTVLFDPTPTGDHHTQQLDVTGPEELSEDKEKDLSTKEPEVNIAEDLQDSSIAVEHREDLNSAVDVNRTEFNQESFSTRTKTQEDPSTTDEQSQDSVVKDEKEDAVDKVLHDGLHNNLITDKENGINQSELSFDNPQIHQQPLAKEMEDENYMGMDDEKHGEKELLEDENALSFSQSSNADTAETWFETHQPALSVPEPEYDDSVMRLTLLRDNFSEESMARFQKFLGLKNLFKVEAMFNDLDTELQATRLRQSDNVQDIENALESVLEASENTILEEVEKMLDNQEKKHDDIMDTNTLDEETQILDDLQELAFTLRQKYSTISDSTPLVREKSPDVAQDDHEMNVTEDIPHSDVKGEDIPRSDVEELDILRSDVEEEDIPRSDVREEDIPRSDVKEEDIPRSDAGEEDIPRADVEEEDIPRADVEEVDIPRADVEEEDIPRSDDEEEDIPRSDVGEEDIPRSDVGEEDIPRSDVEEEDIPRSDVKEEDMPRSDVEEKDIPRSDVEEKSVIPEVEGDDIVAGRDPDERPNETEKEQIVLEDVHTRTDISVEEHSGHFNKNKDEPIFRESEEMSKVPKAALEHPLDLGPGVEVEHPPSEFHMEEEGLFSFGTMYIGWIISVVKSKVVEWTVQMISLLPEEWKPGETLFGCPWQAAVITVMVGVVTFILFFWRTVLAVKKREYLADEKRLSDKIQALRKEKGDALAKMSELQKQTEQLKEIQKESAEAAICTMKKIQDLESKILEAETKNEEMANEKSAYSKLLEEENEKSFQNESRIQKLEKSNEKLQLSRKKIQEAFAKTSVLLDEAKIREDARNVQYKCLEKDYVALKEENKTLKASIKDWEDKHKDLNEQIKVYQKSQKELEDSVVLKDHNVEVLSELLSDLDACEYQKSDTKMLENGDVALDKKTAVKNRIKQMMDVSRVQTTLSVIAEERDRFMTKLLNEEKARKALEEQHQELEHAIASLKSEKGHVENQFKVLQQKNEIMVEMYQQKENALQQRLTKEELERRSKENLLSEVGGKAVEAEEQVKVLRQRINEMEEQMKKTEELYKEQVKEQENKTHSNWVNARNAERALNQEKLESSKLREKLAVLTSQLNERRAPLFRPNSGQAPGLRQGDSYGPSPVSGGAPSPPLMIEGPRRPPSAPVGRRIDSYGPRPPSDPHGRYPDNKHIAGMDMMGPRSSSPANMDRSTQALDPQIKAETQAEDSIECPEPGPGSFLASPIRDSPGPMIQGPPPGPVLHDPHLPPGPHGRLPPGGPYRPPGPGLYHPPPPHGPPIPNVPPLPHGPPLPANGHPGMPLPVPMGEFGPRPTNGHAFQPRPGPIMDPRGPPPPHFRPPPPHHFGPMPALHGARGLMGPRPSLPPEMRLAGSREYNSPPTDLPPGVPMHLAHDSAYGQVPSDALQNSKGAPPGPGQDMSLKQEPSQDSARPAMVEP